MTIASTYALDQIDQGSAQLHYLQLLTPATTMPSPIHDSFCAVN